MGVVGTLPPPLGTPVEGELTVPTVLDDVALGLVEMLTVAVLDPVGVIGTVGVTESVGVAEGLTVPEDVTEGLGLPVDDTVPQSGAVITLVSSVTAPLMASTRP